MTTATRITFRPVERLNDSLKRMDFLGFGFSIIDLSFKDMFTRPYNYNRCCMYRILHEFNPDTKGKKDLTFKAKLGL